MQSLQNVFSGRRTELRALLIINKCWCVSGRAQVVSVVKQVKMLGSMHAFAFDMAVEKA